MLARIVVAACAAAFVLTGCSAAPIASAPEPQPTTETALPAPDWEPDIVITREFDGADGPRTCTILIQVMEPAGASDAAKAEIAAARAFLADGDWDAIEVSLDEFDEADLAARREQGVSDPELLTMQLQDKIREAMATAGAAGEAISTQSQTSCV